MVSIVQMRKLSLRGHDRHQVLAVCIGAVLLDSEFPMLSLMQAKTTALSRLKINLYPTPTLHKLHRVQV